MSRDSADRAEELLAEGWNLLIFPEGGRSPDGWGQEHRGGAAWLAARSGRPLVPLHIQGTGRLWPRGAKRIYTGRTKVTFGAPIYPDLPARQLVGRLEGAIAALADQTAGTDWWSARMPGGGGDHPRPHRSRCRTLAPHVGAWPLPQGPGPPAGTGGRETVAAQVLTVALPAPAPRAPEVNPAAGGNTGSVDLRQLDALVAIADHGSFSRAASALHTVQSNISGHIAASNGSWASSSSTARPASSPKRAGPSRAGPGPCKPRWKPFRPT